MTCLICGGPRAGHPPCAICNDSSLVRLCTFCRAEPANADWNERDMATGSRDDVAADDYLPRAGTLADMQEQRARIRVQSALERRIYELLTVGLEVVEEYRYGARARRRRAAAVRRRRWVTLSTRKIAKHVGCSHTYVLKIARKYTD